MKHYGDICKINGAEIEPVWCITGGSPCQDLSIAGKRAGFQDENGELTRSGLFMEMVRIIKEMREGDIKNGRTNEYIRPRFVIWENVAGAFTSNRGEDFRTVLEEFCRIKENGISIPMPDGGRWAHSGAIINNGFSLAWRLMDSQYFGVPQRRKRIALIVDYGGYNATDILLSGEPFVGDITDGRFGKVLPVSESLRGNVTQSKQKGQGVAPGVENGIGEADCSFTLKIRGGSDTYIKPDGSVGTAGKGALIQTEQSATLGVSQDQTLFAPAYGRGRDSFNSGSNAQFSMSVEKEVQPPITERGAGGVCSMMYCIGNGQVHQSYLQQQVGTLNCMHNQQAVILNNENTKNTDYVARRLTPTECERLQGFPDGWTDIPGASDTARYKALGNSIALPQWQIIIDNMQDT